MCGRAEVERRCVRVFPPYGGFMCLCNASLIGRLLIETALYDSGIIGIREEKVSPSLRR